MSIWKEYRFSEMLVDESISYGVVQPGAHIEKNSVPIIRVNNIKNGNINTNDVLKVASLIEEKYQRTRLSGGELLITVVGSIGECAIVPATLTGWNVARAVSVARIKETFDKRFVKYALKTEDVIFQMYGNTNDTVQPTLNLSSLKEIRFNLPPLPEQKAIASVLSSLDDKIDLLHSQNKTLEAMAETLFRQWFVEEVEDGWEERKLGDVVQFLKGKKPNNAVEVYVDGLVPQILIETFDTGKTLFSEPENMIIANQKDILMVMDGASSGRVEIGFIGIVGSTIGLFKPTDDFNFPLFLFFSLKSNEDFIKDNTTGSAIPHADKALVLDLDFVYFKINKVYEFEQIADTWFKKKLINRNQIRTLEKLRDTLLPKLMSGEVRVKI